MLSGMFIYLHYLAPGSIPASTEHGGLDTATTIHCMVGPSKVWTKTVAVFMNTGKAAVIKDFLRPEGNNTVAAKMISRYTSCSC